MESWHWFVLGTLLFVAETFGAGGFLICIGLAALVMSGLLFLFASLAWQWQLALFAVLSIVLTVLYAVLFRRFNQKTDSPTLNDRAGQLVGLRVTLEKSITNGRGVVTIDDVRWKVTADEDIPAGTAAEVVASEGMLLHLRALRVRPGGS